MISRKLLNRRGPKKGKQVHHCCTAIAQVRTVVLTYKLQRNDATVGATGALTYKYYIFCDKYNMVKYSGTYPVPDTSYIC